MLVKICCTEKRTNRTDDNVLLTASGHTYTSMFHMVPRRRLLDAMAAIVWLFTHIVSSEGTSYLFRLIFVNAFEDLYYLIVFNYATYRKRRVSFTWEKIQ